MSEILYLMHQYNQVEIPQRTDDGYINITKLGQAVGKRVDNWQRLESTKELLQAFEQEQMANYLRSEVVKPAPGIITVEGRYGGTYAAPDIAIQFAQWCSPKFALFVSRIVREWMKNQQQPEIAELTMSERLLIILQKEVELEKVQKQLLLQQEETLAKLAKIEEDKEVAKEELRNIPFSQNQALPITRRFLLSKMVREYAIANHLSFSVVWKELYSDFLYRYHVNLTLRAKSLGKNKNALDYLELNPELMEQFYDLASEKLKESDQ